MADRDQVTTYSGYQVRPHNGFPAEICPTDHTTALTYYDPTGIPAALQTRDYAMADLHQRFGVEIDRWTAPSVAANAIYYLHEAVLTAMPGSDTVRRGQLRHLLGHPAEIRVIPQRHGWGWARTGFSLLRFDDRPASVHITTDMVTLILDGDAHVAEYIAIVADLARLALPADESAELIGASRR